MKRDYVVSPSMIGAKPGVIWSYDNSSVLSTFNDSHPLNVSAKKCNDLSICLWYVSPLIELGQSTKIYYALLGEPNKWTAVSQQRILAISSQETSNISLITVQGIPNEIVPFNFFHSTLLSITVQCRMSSDAGQARIIVAVSNVRCY